MNAHSVREILVSRSADWGGRFPHDLFVYGPVYDRRRASGRHPSVRIFRGRSRVLPHDLAIKVYDSPPGGTKVSEWVSREAMVLDRLMTIRSGRATIAPAWHFSSIEHGIICTQWLRGITMRNVLRASGSISGLRKRTLQRAGRWLREYHDAMGRRAGEANLSDRLETLNALLEKCSDPASQPYDRHKRILADYEASHKTVPVDISISHGDFSPQNLMFVDFSLNLAGFDFSLPGEAPITEDIVTFLMNRFVDRLTTDPKVLIGANWEAVPEYRALMLGYCDDCRVPNGQLLSWQMLHSALVRLLHLKMDLARAGLTQRAAAYGRREIVRMERVADVVANGLG
jgi:aminoglycoside phosphotransferase (APT) family kinase protein